VERYNVYSETHHNTLTAPTFFLLINWTQHYKISKKTKFVKLNIFKFKSIELKGKKTVTEIIGKLLV